MNKLLKYHFIFFTCVIYYNYLNSQTVFHQDMFHGGVTAGGFSTGKGVGTGTVNLYIEPGSTIRKVYLFSYTQRYPPIAPITVNGTPYRFDTIIDRIMDVSHPCPCATPSRLYAKDITINLINSSTSTFNINIPPQIGLPINAGWWTAFLYIEYENASLPLTFSSVIINNQNLIGNESYIVNNLNPININFPVGFSLYSDRTGAISGSQPFAPNSYIYFNNNQLGIIGGVIISIIYGIMQESRVIFIIKTINYLVWMMILLTLLWTVRMV